MTLLRPQYLLLIFILAWSTYYVVSKQDDVDIQVSPNMELPMFTGETLVNTTYNAAGIRNYEITSAHLEYFSESGNTVFEQPRLKVYENGTIIEWDISAQKGILTKNNVLTLYDNVVAKNLLPEASFEHLSSAKLSIRLDNRDFWTDTLVTLFGPQFETIGQAMEGNFSDRHARLFNKVHGRYENLAP
jgi:lipopolysaccharide export system protein LptC